VHHQLAGTRAVFASSSATDEAAALTTCSTHLRSLDRIDLLRATPAVGDAVQTLIDVRPVDSTLTACFGGHGSQTHRVQVCRWAPLGDWRPGAWRKALADGRCSTCRTFAPSRSLSVRRPRAVPQARVQLFCSR
jgi:hypothetical protein